MVVQTDSNILMFQFENVKWQYTTDRSRPKRSRDKEAEQEEASLGDVYSKSSTRVHTTKDSLSSKQDLPLNKSYKSRALLKPKKQPSGKAARSP